MVIKQYLPQHKHKTASLQVAAVAVVVVVSGVAALDLDSLCNR